MPPYSGTPAKTWRHRLLKRRWLNPPKCFCSIWHSGTRREDINEVSAKHFFFYYCCFYLTAKSAIKEVQTEGKCTSWFLLVGLLVCMCEHTFQVIDLVVDFSRRLPGGPSVCGSEGEVTVRCTCAEQTAACGFTASSACFVLVWKKNKADLFFFLSVLAVSWAVCLSRQIRLLSLRLQELKTLFTSIQGIHKTCEGVAAATKLVNN